jgi:predicted component of type VI protein secretion system
MIDDSKWCFQIQEVQNGNVVAHLGHYQFDSKQEAEQERANALQENKGRDNIRVTGITRCCAPRDVPA